MIVGLGIDLVDIRRMRRLHGRFGDSLARRLLAPCELAALADAADPARFLAKRFAAKEAAAKALGTGISAGVRFIDLRVERAAGCAPRMHLDGAARRHAEVRGVTRVHLSLSDEREHVAACVILEGG